MNSLKNKLSLLKNMSYLDAELQREGSRLFIVKLLENGKRLRQQIETEYCKKLTSTEIETKEILSMNNLNTEFENVKDISSRSGFVYTNDFRDEMQFVRKNWKNVSYVSKIISNMPKSDAKDLPLQFQSSTRDTKILITDRFFHKASGLAKLYNIQRERKIWWMRFSADPSRYFLESLEPENKESSKKNVIPNAQSISIKSRLPIGSIDVENITLVPLHEALLQNEHHFEIYDDRTMKNEMPAVIRSVINLDVAACALIFDGISSNKRENTLLLNRKLTPYQCFVTRLKEEDSNDLRDLCTHISNVIRRAGLRLLNINDYIKNAPDLQTEFDVADMLGIPYTILISSNSLSTGLLEMRSRDTTLSETIHISDIPGYLLNIFHTN